MNRKASLLAAVIAIASTSCVEPQVPQLTLGHRAKHLINEGGLAFRDLNNNGQLDRYEDWRLTVEERIEDLVSKMTPEEKAGMMLITTLNASEGGVPPEEAAQLINNEHMTRFIFRNPVVPEPDLSVPAGRSGVQITVEQAAEYTNAVQELAESTRLGIPVLFKSNARNHYEQDARAGISVAAGSFSTWPKEAGLAATRDLELVRVFADTMRQEWASIGLRGMYGYMADLATEPRWHRVHETLTENADLAADIISTLVRTLQGERLGPSSIALTIKHFPGGGPQDGGGDPHYYFGRNQAYPSDNFTYHLKPFIAAIDAGASAIMPYYGIPVGQKWMPNDVGMVFSKGIVNDLLREQLGFKGYVNSDSGIIGEPGTGRAWGMGDASVEEQLVAAIEAGADVLSGFDRHEKILNLVASGALSQARVDLSVSRLLREQFELGLFENPYVDPKIAVATVGNPDFQARANLAQRKSIVLLQNLDDLLPLPRVDGPDPVRVYTLGIDAATVREYGYDAVAGDVGTGTAIAVPEDMDVALIRVSVMNPIVSLADDPNERPPRATIFGGASPDELNLLAFSDMAESKSWQLSPPLEQIRGVMRSVGASNTVLAIYFRQPYVIDSASGLRDAGGIVALFGADDSALMDVLTGRFNPVGKLPFALARSRAAIERQASDAPGYPPEDTLYPFGFGLSYAAQ